MKHLKFIITILILLFLLILLNENSEQLAQTLSLKVDLYFWAKETGPMPFYLVLIIGFLFGLLIAAFCGIFERFKHKKTIKRLLKENREKENELDSLKKLPVVKSREEELEFAQTEVAQD